uniref:Uncharacterized protein n=1 Tax=Anopheles arabiensis TaxID=7173 RepID=A0A182HXX9_ANOAR
MVTGTKFLSVPPGPGGIGHLPQHFVLARKIENIISLFTAWFAHKLELMKVRPRLITSVPQEADSLPCSI